MPQRKVSPRKLVADWNAKHPIGTEVCFHPVIGRSECRAGKTTSLAWVLSGHTAVVFLSSERGCVAIEACEPVYVDG
jgi:hypothetical protein